MSSGPFQWIVSEHGGHLFRMLDTYFGEPEKVSTIPPKRVSIMLRNARPSCSETGVQLGPKYSVCHLLATGQRVLVTSHTARALSVLRSKFPKEVSDLCVVLLGDDLTAMQALQDSVRGITDRFNDWNPHANQKTIATLEQQLHEARRTEAGLLAKMRSIRESAMFQHPRLFGSYEGTTQRIALRLHEEETKYSWFSMRPSEKTDPPLTDLEASELLQLLRSLKSDAEQEVSKTGIDPSLLPSPNDFISQVRNEENVVARYDAAKDKRNHECYLVLERMPSDERILLTNSLSVLCDYFYSLIRHIQPWVKNASTQIMADRDRAWRELLTITKIHLDAIEPEINRISELKVTGLNDRDHHIIVSDPLTPSSPA